jgi:hypothetical protein
MKLLAALLALLLDSVVVARYVGELSGFALMRLEK